MQDVASQASPAFFHLTIQSRRMDRLWEMIPPGPMHQTNGAAAPTNTSEKDDSPVQQTAARVIRSQFG